MLDFTVRTLARMLRIWLPDPRGRHRAEPVPAAYAAEPPSRPRPPGRNGYPVAHSHPRALTLDERHRRRATRGLRERRRGLYLASLGLDTEPPVTNGGQVISSRHVTVGHPGAAR
ncbi:hypothetical protein [Streptomyces adelaidensis]|uniref:hypothetical protein n=1 Tax=Streptomyces adelaidensis TaxID=2796465 RepID=UPI001907BD0C|nr:hypothetical protein [Streptomyces adelaidensis]